MIPHDIALEREALGVALLGYPLPHWLNRGDFYCGAHPFIFEAVEALGAGANLATVNAYLRDVQSGPWDKPVASALELYAMFDEADHAMRMGWAVDFPRLRELALQRRLLEAVRRVEIGFEEGGLNWGEACEMLEAHAG